MDRVSIKSYKHDGSLHRTWEMGCVLENNDEYIITATNRNYVVESNQSRWKSREASLSIFSKKDWFNVICMFRKEGICYYCNVSSPAVVDHGVVKYIDYDLDAKLTPTGKIRILDKKEFEYNSVRYQYSTDLVKIAQYTLEKVVTLMRDGVFPFDDEIVKQYYEVYKDIFHL
ncbi:MAG: DUF402 domain-containing protein [Coprobacillus sp.]|nr:DUF402 domain-containing protein [Coprobacillus sp.]